MVKNFKVGCDEASQGKLINEEKQNFTKASIILLTRREVEQYNITNVFEVIVNL